MQRTRIRPAGPLDLLALSVPPALTLQLNSARRLLYPHHPLGEVLQAWLRPVEVALLLAYGRKGLLASALACPHRAGGTWEVSCLAAWARAGEEVHPLWEALLGRLGAVAGRRGALRLLATLPAEQHLAPFRSAGFVPFAEEIVLRWDGQLPPPDPIGPGLRPIRPGDAWAVHRLYLGMTPSRVQQAEGYHPDAWRPRRGERLWLWEEGGHCRACLRRHSGPRGAILDLLLDPTIRQAAPALLTYGLGHGSAPTYLLLRAYQGELLEVARQLGFRPYARQVLLVRELAVPHKRPQPVPSRISERPLGAAPSTPSIRICHRL